MACHLPPSTRDILVRLFRQDVYRRAGFVEFPHQAALRLATEGLELTGQLVEAPSEADQAQSLAFQACNDYSLRSTPVQVQIGRAHV